MNESKLKLFGIAGWRLAPKEPRHNTWHNALFDSSKKLNIDLEYLGLVNTHKTNWITQVLPDSILRRFPYVNLFSFIKVVRVMRQSKGNLNIFYIFEGSLFWAYLLTSMSIFVPNSTVICNLFSSSKYNKRLFKNESIRLIYLLLFKILLKNDRVVITFDTQLMTNRFNKLSGLNLIRFPVPSSFPFNRRIKAQENVHQRVLVNLRSFPLNDLHYLLQNSCMDCTFVFPRGPLASVPLSIEFGKYENAEFDETVVPVTEYESYIDSFDYMIFLYEPSIDASGRILDSITRGLPTCVPRQATEWSFIAKMWGRSCLFDWNELQNISQTFNHPVFTLPKIDQEPPFTPKGSIAELIEIGSRTSHSDHNYGIFTKLLVLNAIFLHSVVLTLVNGVFGVVTRIKQVFSRLVR